MKKLLLAWIMLVCMGFQTQAAVLTKANGPLAADAFIYLPQQNTQKLARTQWLPDYEPTFSKRISAGDPIIEPTCSPIYKYTSSNCSGKNRPSGDICDGKFEYCSCKNEYQYNASNCKNERKPMGDNCNGNFNQCEYKTCTEGGYGETKEFDKICNEILYAKKICYTCREKNCMENCDGYSEDITSCPAGQTIETCGKCSSFAKCVGKICPNAKTDCKNGCISSTQSGCESICVECKSCIKNAACTQENYPYIAENKPLNGIFEECTIGCGDNTVHYKMSQCVIGYINPNVYWCDTPKSTDCTILGYILPSSCGSKKIEVRCPFDSNYVYCPGPSGR